MTAKAMLKSIDFNQLLRAAEGLTQWRAMGLSFLTWIAGGLVMALGQMLANALGSVFLGFVFALLSAVVIAGGISAVGILLQDRAKDLEPRGFADALRAGLRCLPRFIGFALLLLAAMLVLYIAAAIVYFICKIPFLGPVLFFLAHPVLVVVASVFFIALYWVAAPLLAPAIWDGRSLRSAVSLVVAIARSRIVPVVLMLLVLYFVVAVISLIVFSGFVPGFSSMTGLAASIIGSGMLASLGGALGAASSSGYAVAGALSTVIMFAVVMTLLAQVMLMGVNLIYLMVTDDLDEEASEASLQAGIVKAREKARQAQELAQQKAREMAERLRQQRANIAAASSSATPQAPTPVAEPPALSPAPLTCPACLEPVEPDDRFCGHCGYKLK